MREVGYLPMDWKIFLSTFVAIFIAELGDKTQFAALAVGAQGKSIFSAWLGVVLALSVAGTIGVLAGSLIGELIPASMLRWVSGLLFVIIGAWILAGR